MVKFLQDYYADALLTQVYSHDTMWWSKNAAVEIAMLGLPEEANAILHVLSEHDQFSSVDAGFEFKCIWHYAGLSPPGVDNTSEGAVWVTSSEQMSEDEAKAREQFYPLPDWLDWNLVDAKMLEKMQREAGTPDVDSYGEGLIESRKTAAHAAVVAMASGLNRHDIIAGAMPDMVRRIQNHQQWSLLRLISHVWTEYLLNGWLREQLGVTEGDIQAYARYVLETVKERFGNGPLRPADLYDDLTTAQLVDVIDSNTVSDPRYKTYLIDLGVKTNECDYGDYRPGNIEGLSDDDRLAAWSLAWHNAHQKPNSTSIMNPGATLDQIAEAETRIGRRLPEDIKEFFKLTNGCDPVRANTWFRNRLPSLEQVYFEQEDYMDDYGFQVVPGLPHSMGIKWPGFPDGGIAMYQHEGQGTQYVWIVGAESIKRSKEQLQVAYEKASDEDKAMIEGLIKYHYGGREGYDSMIDYCYYEVEWAEPPHAIHPNLHSYLASIAAESRHHIDRSPIKAVEP